MKELMTMKIEMIAFLVTLKALLEKNASKDEIIKLIDEILKKTK